MIPFPCVTQGAQINEAACNMAKEVASEGDALVAGGVSQTPSYLETHSEVEVKNIFRKQMNDFLKKDIDFFIAEVTPTRSHTLFLLLPSCFSSCPPSEH